MCVVARTRAFCLNSQGKATGLGQSYNGMVDCLVKTCRIEGIPAIYKGLSASCLYGGPYVGLNMSINDMMKRLLAGEESTDSLGLGSKLLAGSVAATTAQTIVFPLDTLRRRLQVRPCMHTSDFTMPRAVLNPRAAIVLTGQRRRWHAVAVYGARRLYRQDV